MECPKLFISVMARAPKYEKHQVERFEAITNWTEWSRWSEVVQHLDNAPYEKQWFATLTYNQKDREEDISIHSARKHIVQFGRYLSRKVRGHIELFSVYGDSHIHKVQHTNNGSPKEIHEHIHTIITGDVEIPCWAIYESWAMRPSIRTIEYKRRNGHHNPTEYVSRGFIEAQPFKYEKKNNCYAYMYGGHSVAHGIITPTFCGVRSHRNNCRQRKASESRRSIV